MEAQHTLNSEFTRCKLEREIATLKEKSERLVNLTLVRRSQSAACSEVVDYMQALAIRLG